MKDKRIIIMGICFAIILTFMAKGIESVSIEEVYPLVGVGYDLDENLKYSVPLTVYNYKGEDHIYAENMIGVAKSIGETRETRQLRMDKAFRLGSEREIVISNNQAREGINNILNILLANPEMNDRVLMLVSREKAIDILNYKVEGYPSSAEYIEGMIKNATTFNFLSNEYTLLNAYVKVTSEGENLVLPYIGLDDQGLNYLGMTIFKKDKMVQALSRNDSKIMNMLREKRGSGVITIQDTPEKYINYMAKVKRNIQCNKVDNNYEFVINLFFNGDIMVNNLYKKIDKKEEKEIEEKLAQNVTDMCNGFISKMKNELKVDCLQLGMYGAAKYGRDTGVDWNEIVCNSDIKVKARVNIDKTGRGEY